MVTQTPQETYAFKFCLRPEQSPTYQNLCHYLNKIGWRRTRFHWLAHLNEKNFQFYTPAAECLEFKHLLAQLVTRYCPQTMPVTFNINDHNWPEVLNKIANEYYPVENQLTDQTNCFTWILKPSLLNNGQHIKIFQKLSEIEQHYLNANRLGGEHVLQQYLEEPHLLKGPHYGHKYSIRMFVVLTSHDGAYLYPHGYFNVGLYHYQFNHFNDLRPHLTNEHLNNDGLNVVQIPTDQYPFFKSLYPQIKTIISSVIDGLQTQHPQTFLGKNKFEMALFGFDFMVDNAMKVWLLEANHAPCFPVNEKHPLQNNLYKNFWPAIIDNFLVPMVKKQYNNFNEFKLFEAVGGQS